jgi:hypothetical protein
MLDQDRASLHQLTDAQWEMTGLEPGNRSPLDTASEPIPWVEDDWNRVRLVVAGDQLSVYVNDSKVAESILEEAKNERFFGLFRYSDQTKCRVRNLKYRGEWPKSLPDVESQELAYPAGGPYAMHNSTPDKMTEFNFTGSDLRTVEDFDSQGLSRLGDKDQISSTKEGFNLELRNATDWDRWPGIALTKSIEGDFEVSVRYDGLEFQPVESGWGVSFCLQVGLDDAQESTVELHVQTNAEGKELTMASIRRKIPGDEFETLDIETLTGHSKEGWLKMVRRGGRIHCLVADGEEGNFRLIHSLTVGDAKIRSLSVQAKSSDDKGEVKVVVKSLSLSLKE